MGGVGCGVRLLGVGCLGCALFTIRSTARFQLATMPELYKSFFTGESDPPNDSGKFEVENLAAGADKVLRKGVWTGSAYGCVGLYLSPDNLRVINDQFFMWGTLKERVVKMSCSKIWADNHHHYDTCSGKFLVQCMWPLVRLAAGRGNSPLFSQGNRRRPACAHPLWRPV